MKKTAILFMGLLFLFANYSHAQYCFAMGGCDEHISRVQIGTIDNTSSCTLYGDYTALSTIVSCGSTYAITVTNGEPYLGDQCGIWVDWDRNQVFDDEAITVSGNPGWGPYTANITVPNITNGPVRMRVRIVYNATPAPCNNTNYGEVEDYTLVVTGGLEPPAILVTPPSVNVFINGMNSTVTVPLQISNPGGLDLEWSGSSNCLAGTFPGDHALKFNGTNQLADLLFPFGNFTQFSFEFWRKSEGTGSGCCPRMLSIWDLGVNAGGVDGLVIEHQGAEQDVVSIWFSPDGNNQEVAFFPVPQNEWHHIAFTFDGVIASVFLDGNLMNSLPYPPGSFSTFNHLQFGGDSFIDGGSGRYFNGSLDEVRFWDRALTQTEIQTNMCAQLTGSEPGLVACFRLDEGMGNLANELTASVPPALLMNGPTWVNPGACAYSLLSMSPTGGTIPGGSSAMVDLVFSSNDAPFGIYNCDLVILSNDPGQPETIVPLQIEIGDANVIPVSNWSVALSFLLMLFIGTFYVLKRRQ